MPRAFLVKRLGNNKGQNEKDVSTSHGAKESAEDNRIHSENENKLNLMNHYYHEDLKYDDIKTLPQAHCMGKYLSNPYFGEFVVASRSILSGNGRHQSDLQNYRLLELENELALSKCKAAGSLIGLMETRAPMALDQKTPELAALDSMTRDPMTRDAMTRNPMTRNPMTRNPITSDQITNDSDEDDDESDYEWHEDYDDNNNNNDDDEKNKANGIEIEEEEKSAKYLMKAAQHRFIRHHQHHHHHHHHHESDHEKMKFGGKPQFQCNQCEKTFKTKYTLNIHRKMPSHTTLKPFVCPTCGKGFRLSSTLCRHKIIHTSQRPHRCHVCQKSFNRSSTLKTHLRTHSNTKEFTCNICNKGFHQKGNLRNHVLIHTGEKPYECSVCKKSFNKLSNLKFHMHSHTDQKPYRCRYCKMSFCKRGELKQHIARCKRENSED